MRNYILILLLASGNCWSQSQLDLLFLKEGENFMLYELLDKYGYNCQLENIVKVGKKYKVTSIGFKIDSIKFVKDLDYAQLRELFYELDTLGDSMTEKVVQNFEIGKVNKHLSFFNQVVYYDIHNIHEYHNRNSICLVLKSFDSTSVYLVELGDVHPIIDVFARKYLVKLNFGQLGEFGYDYDGKLRFENIIVNFNGLLIDDKALKRFILGKSD